MNEMFEGSEVAPCVTAAEQFDTFFVPRLLHLSGFIEETAEKLFHGCDTNCSTPVTHGAINDRETEDEAYLMYSINI